MNDLLPVLTNNNILVLEDDQNNNFGSIRCIDSLPVYSERISSEGIKKLQILFGETIKSIATIPNSALEVTFNPEVAKGLKDGTLKLMESEGKKLAHVVNNKGKMVKGGVGRIKPNTAQQMTALGFEMLSFAVAQSHLQDISIHLTKIENLCETINKKLEIEKQAKIENDINYLEKTLQNIINLENPISLSKENTLENIIRDCGLSESVLLKEFNEFITKINNLKDQDTFGTEHTYKSIKGHTREYEKYINTFRLINKIHILLRMISGYIDPLSKKNSFNLLDIKGFTNNFSELQNKYIQAIKSKANDLFRSSTFNAKDTLELRRRDVHLTVELQNHLFERIMDSRESFLNRLDTHLKNLSKPKELRYALKLNSQNEIEEASLV